MSKLEAIQMVMQTVQNMEGLRRDIRANAELYKLKAEQGADITALSRVISEDIGEYNKRLNWQKRVFVEDPTAKEKIIAGLNLLGITLDEVKAEYQEILAVLAGIDASRINTKAKVLLMADGVLSTLPSHETIF